MVKGLRRNKLLALVLASAFGPALAQPAPTTAPPVASAASAPFQPSSLPISSFARLPFVESPRLSPDGSRMAGLLAINGRQGVAIVSLFNKAEKAVQIGIPDGTQAIFVRWVNDDNVLIGLRALLPVEGDRWYVSRIIGLNRLTGKITKLMWDSGGQNAADVLRIPSDGSSVILVAAQNTIYTNFEGFWPTVYKIDVATGKKSVALKGREGIMDWNADADGVVRTGMRYAPGSRKFTLMYRGEGGKGSFRQIDVADSRKEEAVLSPFLFMPGTDHALTIHDDDKGRSGIYEVNLLTRDDVRTVFVAPEGAEIDLVWTASSGKDLLGAFVSSAKNTVHWFDPALAALQTQFDKAVGDRTASIVSMSNDRQRLLVRVDRPDNPGMLYFYDVADGALRNIASINSDIGSKRLSPVSLVRYKARDGLEIEAVMTVPKGGAPRNLPIVMMPHGGPWGQDTLGYDYWAQFIASRGYVVIQPNFRGSTGYGSEFTRKGQGQMGLAMQDDITDGLRWAVEQGYADPKRACIVGASYGGYAAMWGIAKDPDLYRCAISIAGVSNVRREVNDMADSVFGAKYRDDWQRMTPDFAAVSPSNAVARIKAPLLLIHGKKDVTVDHNQSNSMHGKMRDAGKTVEFLSLPEADHHYTRQADREALLNAIEAFLAKHNPA